MKHPKNPLLQSKKNNSRVASRDKVALDAVLEMINDEDYATNQHHSDPDFTTQNGKMMGKGTEVEEGALNDAIPTTLLASEDRHPHQDEVVKEMLRRAPEHEPLTDDQRAILHEMLRRRRHGSITGDTVNDLTDAVKPGVPETPLASDATFFKESDGDFEVSRTASGRIRVADTKSYGAGTPNGGTPSAAPATPATPPVPGTSTPPPQAQPSGNPVPPVTTVNKTPQQLSQEAMNPATTQPANGGALTQQQLNQVLDAVKGATVKNVVSRVRAAMRPHYADIGIKKSPTMLPPRDDMRSHLDETVKDEVKAGVTDKPDATSAIPQQPKQQQWQTPNQDALLNRALASNDKTAVQTEEFVNQVCPGCSGSNFTTFNSDAEDGSLVECLDCGCFFAI